MIILISFSLHLLLLSFHVRACHLVRPLPLSCRTYKLPYFTELDMKERREFHSHVDEVREEFY